MKRNSTCKRIWSKAGRKLSSHGGMTLAEVLLVVGIVLVLAALAFVAVWNYQRSMAQLERDGIAKELFVAAQNHLTAAQGQGYLTKTGYGTQGSFDEDTSTAPISDQEKKVYYYVVTNGTVTGNGGDAFELMLPFGSIDDTVRRGGSYLIRYQPETGTVMDVFYCSTSGSPARFNHLLTVEEYTIVMGLVGDRNKMQRRTFTETGDKSVLGWYGGAEAMTLPTMTLAAPTIEVINGDTLSVRVTDAAANVSNADYTGQYSIKLVVTGELSGAKKAYTLLASGATETAEADRLTVSGSQYSILLDDIRTSGKHFAEISADTGAFIPGENIRVQAVVYSNSALANIAYSAEKTTNSLFADGTSTTTAQIGSFRHLENLDKTVSMLDNNDGTGANDKLKIAAAVQTRALDWSGFTSTGIYGYKEDVSIISLTSDDYFYPISPNYPLTYDGKGYSISNVKASATAAGLFGATTSVSAISNLELIDFDLSGTVTAGALAGALSGCTVSNVLARNSTATYDSADVAAPTVGGLIGLLNGGSVNTSAAALTVSGTGDASVAGGLIGQASGAVTVSGCFSGGHTDKGEYYKHDGAGERIDAIYNVSGVTAGGLIGDAGNTTAISCYSTCSVSGTTTAGGFVGKTSDDATGLITDCYCTGLVSGNGDNAFIGSGKLNAGTNPDHYNRYYKIVNEILTMENGEIKAVRYKGPGATEGVTPIDANTAAFNAFVGASTTWDGAKAYDTELVKVYAGKYNLKTVDQLDDRTGTGAVDYSGMFVATHYGDWPAPEIFFINEPNP